MISTTETFAAVTANGSQNTFSFGFCVQKLDDLKIYSETSAGVRTDITSYISSTTGIGTQPGGTVTLSIIPAAGTRVFLVRLSSFTQMWNASELNLFDPDEVEQVIDKLTLLVQEAKSKAESALRFADGTVQSPLSLTARKGQLLGFNVSTGDVEYTDKAAFTTSVSDAAAAAVQPLVDAAAASAAAAADSEAAAFDSETSAANSASSASGFATTADIRATAALNSQTAASGSATAAGLSAAAAATSAGNALTSANNAAASAATALNAQATEYLGSVAGTAVPATATTKGQYYLITSGGTSQSVTWTVGDKAVYNGTSGSWSRITGFLAPSNTYADGVGSAYTPNGYLYSDGFTTGRGATCIATPRQNILNAGTLDIAFSMTLPASTPSSPSCFVWTSTSSTNPGNTHPHSLMVWITNSGGLFINQNGATASDYRRFTWATFWSAYATGQRIRVLITLTQGSANPVVRINNVDVSSSFATQIVSGSAPDWLGGSLSSTYQITGLNWPVGEVPTVIPILDSLSANERNAWFSYGRIPYWVAQGGDSVKPTTSSWANNPNTSFDFDTFTGASATGFSAQHDNTGNKYGFAFFTLSQSTLPLGRYRCTFTLASTGRALPKLSSNPSGTNAQTLSIGSNTVFIEPIGGYILPIFVADPYATTQGPDAFNFTVSNFECVRVGALALPQIQPGTANVLDATNLGGNDATLTGMVGVTGTDTQFTEALIDARSATRAPTSYLWSDGVTSNRAQIQTPGSRGNIAGASAASWIGLVDVQTSNPATTTFIFNLNNSASPGTSNNTLSAYINSSGNLVVDSRGASSGTDIRTQAVTGFRASFSGQVVFLEFRFTNTTLVIRANGITQVLGTPYTQGSAPNWLESTLNTSFHITGGNWSTGIAPLGQWLNIHLTDAESDAWRITGRPPALIAQGGAVQLLSDTLSNFESGASLGVGAWQSAGNHSAAIVTDVAPPLGTSVVEITATGAGSWVGNAFYATGPQRTIGQRYRARLFAKSVSGNTSFSFSGNLTGTRTITTSWVEYVSDYFTPTSSGTVTIALFLGGVGVVRVDNVRLEIEGALSLPAVQSINVLEDVTNIGGNQARLVGMTPVLLNSVPTSVIEIPARSFTGGTYVEILGGAVTGARKRRIVSVTGNSSVSGNMHLGTTNTGTQIFGSPTVLVSAGDYDIGNGSFNSRIVSANSSLFVMFSNTTTASIHIHLTDL